MPESIADLQLVVDDTRREATKRARRNLVLAAAMIGFLLLPAERHGVVLVLANSLMVLGLGFRWRAARQFGGRLSPLGPVVVPALVAAMDAEVVAALALA